MYESLSILLFNWAWLERAPFLWFIGTYGRLSQCRWKTSYSQSADAIGLRFIKLEYICVASYLQNSSYYVSIFISVQIYWRFLSFSSSLTFLDFTIMLDHFTSWILGPDKISMEKVNKNKSREGMAWCSQIKVLCVKTKWFLTLRLSCKCLVWHKAITDYMHTSVAPSSYVSLLTL